VVLAGDSYDDAYAHAIELEKREKMSFVHPFDDPEVIAGQGTIGMEILRQHAQPIHAVFCCVGGGGLISGIAAYVKRLRPETRIIGVEAVDADAMARSLQPASASGSSTSACSPMAQRSSTSARRPSASARCTSTKWCGSIPTPSARRSRTSSRTRAPCSNRPARWPSPASRNMPRRHRLKGKTLIATASGANINFDRLRFVAERAEIGEQREAVFAVTLPERPGAYKRFVSLIGARNITEFNYRYNDQRDAHVFVGVQVASRAESMRLLEHLRKHDYPTLDLTDDEMAKGHIRHLVGGHSPRIEHEILYRFEFPERPGALMNFLNRMSAGWNISLFHYRNHGADYGRCWSACRCRRARWATFEDFLKNLGYAFWNETSNPAYRLFLG
jgi:threonine dehydratase